VLQVHGNGRAINGMPSIDLAAPGAALSVKLIPGGGGALNWRVT
jgi:hypothetical protein